MRAYSYECIYARCRCLNDDFFSCVLGKPSELRYTFVSFEYGTVKLLVDGRVTILSTQRGVDRKVVLPVGIDLNGSLPVKSPAARARELLLQQNDGQRSSLE